MMRRPPFFPLFHYTTLFRSRMPIIGCLIRGMGALPVFRRQDDPTRMGGNEATLEAAAQVLVQGGALTIFPEGKSHSEPQLAALRSEEHTSELQSRENLVCRL